jgi:hypothetical protein
MRGTLLCLAGVVLLAATTEGAGAARPSLVVTHFAPVTVAGAGFGPGERVVVTVVAGKSKHVRRVRAAASGRFRVRFDVRAALGCGPALAVSALGASGSTAAARLPFVRCPPDGPPPRDR